MSLSTVRSALSRGRAYRSRVNPFRAAGVLLTAFAPACAAGSAAPAGAPVPDPTASATELVSATALRERTQINFNWTLDEAGSRVRGRGVVRLEPPDRLRLDLFGPRSETYLAAALVGDETRMPATARENAPVPSPALLWAGLGVVRPPPAAALERATATADQTVLRYRAGSGDIYEYRVAKAPAVRLDQLQRLGSRGPLETVRLEYGDSGNIQRATYRDWSAYRDLTLDIESIEDAEAFPETIWTP